MSINNDIVKEIKRLSKRGELLKFYEMMNKDVFSENQKEELRKSDFLKELEEKNATFKDEYQSWYFKSSRVVKQLAPERYDEFCELYKLSKPAKSIDYITYTISDYLNGLVVTRGVYKEEVVNPFNAFYSKFEMQLSIIGSVANSAKSLIIDLEGTIQSHFFDSEIQVVEDLMKKNHLRAAGAICGVVLEQHFASVCSNHKIKFRKKNVTISDYNEALKKEGIIDTPTWRLIQRLGDIRNLSVHSKDRGPTKDEIEDLIRGCKKLIAELY